jgi:mono/diheme cytochrome c family protein
MKRLPLLAALTAMVALPCHPARAASAADNFEKHCTGCHGADGKAQTRIGRKAGAKDLTDKANQAKLSDAEIFKTVKQGRFTPKGEEKMEAFGDRLSDPEITAIVAYVRQFAK